MLIDACWWSIRDIRFSRDQVAWILKYAEDIREGTWPPNPKPNGYTDSPISAHRTRPDARFTRPCEMLAEVERRLQMTGVDGKLLRAELATISDIDSLSYESRRALNYCSGWRAKRMDYKSWRKQRDYRRMNTKRYSFGD